MSQSFLTPWPGAWVICADICRIVTLLCAGLALVFWGPDKVIAFLAVTGILLIPRVMRMPGPFDAALALTMLVSTLTGAIGWYEHVMWWDKVAHFVTTGSAAAMLSLMVAAWGLVDRLFESDRPLYRTRVTVQTASLGMSVALIWEIMEWIYKDINTDDPPATYLDTMADLLAGALGSVAAAGALLLWVRAGGAAPHSDSVEGTQLGARPLHSRNQRLEEPGA
ncbi:hypothetical protein [Arthrobacter castelli]|uniref:hypothetical protein n=1 Tax=Arthrobacter castelli TaxID=271431 RepID=UPI0004792E66|nr:hypothetical protein [Arthrobacter castelli]